MKKEEIETLVNLRQNILNKFSRLRDYKSNNNAIMKEIDHAKALHEVIIEIDKVLKEHVTFSDKK